MARILSVVWYKILPARFGGQKGIASFNDHLSKYHELVCICSSNNEPTGQEKYQIIKNLPDSRGQVVSPFAWRKIKKAVLACNSTHLIIEHPYYGLAGIWLRRKKSLKLIVHSHNIESDRFRQLGKWWWKLLFWLEKKTHRAADLNLFKTEDDQAYAVLHFGIDRLKCRVVPYGLNRTAIPRPEERTMARKKIAARHDLAMTEKIILFNGTLDYTPNADAVVMISKKIIPLLRKKSAQPFKVIVCGRIQDKKFQHLKKIQHENYLYAGDVDDIEDYFKAADIFINPVIEGGGIRVKTMEAIAFNCTVISTASAAAGIDGTATGDKLVVTADGDWESFTDTIIKNWDLQNDTPGSFFEKYSWEKIVKEVAAAIDNL